MGKHHTEDYKLSAVKYALRTDNQVETCEVFDCKRSSLQDWIDLYQKTGKFQDHLIVMDNAMFHKSPAVKKAVEESGNKILYSVAYYPRSNPIEQYFNQVKHYIKKESPISFEDIKKTLAHSIKQVKEKHYQNYFIHAFNVEWLKKDRKTRRRPPKLYKN